MFGCELSSIPPKDLGSVNPGFNPGQECSHWKRIWLELGWNPGIEGAYPDTITSDHVHRLLLSRIFHDVQEFYSYVMDFPNCCHGRHK